MNDQSPIYEYERYELLFRHYITEDSGRNIKPEEPVKVQCVSEIGSAIPTREMIKRLFYQLMNYLDKEDENEN